MKLTKYSYNHPVAKKANNFFEILIESIENQFYLEITYPPLSSSNSLSSPFFILSAFPFAMLSKNKLNKILKELKKTKKEVIKNESSTSP